MNLTHHMTWENIDLQNDYDPNKCNAIAHQKETSQKADVSYNSYVSYENGRHLPSLDIALRIKRVYGLASHWRRLDARRKQERIQAG